MRKWEKEREKSEKDMNERQKDNGRKIRERKEEKTLGSGLRA